MQAKNLNAAFNCWISAVQRAADKHAPYKSYKPKKNENNIPWFNEELQDITNTKNMYLKLYRLYKRSQDKEKYKAVFKKCQ